MRVTLFARYFKKLPDKLGKEEVKEYFLHLVGDKHASYGVLNVTYCALKFIYTVTLGRPEEVEKIPRLKRPVKMPVILDKEEVHRLLVLTENLKHRAILTMAYSSGLRISEVAHLKISDIDTARMAVLVQQGKGKKDRYTISQKRPSARSLSISRPIGPPRGSSRERHRASPSPRARSAA